MTKETRYLKTQHRKTNRKLARVEHKRLVRSDVLDEKGMPIMVEETYIVARHNGSRKDGYEPLKAWARRMANSSAKPDLRTAAHRWLSWKGL